MSKGWQSQFNFFNHFSALGDLTFNSYQWARSLKQQSSISVYNLTAKENNIPFLVSVFSEQTDFCHFHFPFAANKLKSPFSASSIFFYKCRVVALNT
jgi:hypothetical protein